MSDGPTKPKGRPHVRAFFDARTSSVQYVVSDPATRVCAIIDPVLDYDEPSGSVATRNADAIVAYVERHDLRVEWILDTHPHADHLTAARVLKDRTGAQTAIGAEVLTVQAMWAAIYGLPVPLAAVALWDRLFVEGDTFLVGSIEGRVMASPGHTLASISYVVGNAAFVHDTLFMPDGGTARADFPGGSAHQLWASIQRLLALPDETRIFTGHDYRPGGRDPLWESTVAEQKRANAHVHGQTEASFVALREARDRTMPLPKLILPALQVNIFGGRLPEAEPNGRRYLKIPIDAFPSAVWGGA